MLTVREHMALDLANRRYSPAYAGQRAEHSMILLGYSEARFAQVITVLLERPDAEAAYPQLVHRLRRLREGRRNLRRGRSAA